MNDLVMKPYLIQPRLIPQPTWGGTYIATMKAWSHLPYLENVNIGQSYELYGKSFLFTELTRSDDALFVPDMDGVAVSSPRIALSDLIAHDPGAMTGDPARTDMNVLIKFTQALGNSFQLHVRKPDTNDRWTPKPESWFFLEPGRMTYGLNPASDLSEYKKTCETINAYMMSLSADVRSHAITLSEAKAKSAAYIAEKNPWQYVNVYDVPKGELIDLSTGGIHHSWEQSADPTCIGNIVYEVQLDVMDDKCTIRSFDQGKLLSDGSIRTIHIDDYFTFIDTDATHNDISFGRRVPHGEKLLATPYYMVDYLQVDAVTTRQTNASFKHVFVSQGSATITAGTGSVVLTTGHSAFIPAGSASYTIEPLTTGTVIIETYLPASTS
jgi:mannose-6-phosphate isomerase class I